MNPAATTATSGGLGLSAVVVINYVLTLFSVAPMPGDVQAALAALITAGVGYAIHTLSCKSAQP